MGFVFELCDKGSLFKMLHEASRPRLSPKQKVDLAAQIGFGLSYLHTKRKDDKRAIVHRDISARNILLTGPQDKLVVKIADFGVARVMVNETLSTTTISGSPPYMAPEQLIGSNLTVQCDMWGFGVLIWEMLNEKIPWATDTCTFPSIYRMTEIIVQQQQVFSTFHYPSIGERGGERERACARARARARTTHCLHSFRRSSFRKLSKRCVHLK